MGHGYRGGNGVEEIGGWRKSLMGAEFVMIPSAWRVVFETFLAEA